MTQEYKSRKKTAEDPVASAAVEIGNRPPQAPEIEQAVLGAMMMEDSCVYKATEVLTERCFYDPKNRLVFSAIRKLFDRHSPIDIMTVTERLREDGALEKVGGTVALARLTSGIGSAANIEYYIRILQQKTIQRDLIAAGYKMLKNAFDETCDVDNLIQESQDSVYRAVQGNMRSAYVPFADSLNKALERIQRSQESTGLTGIPSGFPSLDAITMGWQDGNLIVIGARPGHGKTAIALNMARCAAFEHKIPTAFFSLEMTDVELADRLIATEAGLSSDKRKGRTKMEEGEWTQLETALTRAVNAPLYIDETPGLTISEFTSKIKRMHLEQNIRIAFVDYIQLMHGSPDMTQYRALEIGEISRKLKETAKELKIPIITLAQLNRNLTTRMGSVNGRPMLSDLKDSGSIEQDADIVLFVNQPGKLGYTEQPEGFTELIIAKNRAGETGIINLNFNGDLVKFTESTESLYEYAARLETEASGEQAPSAWDRVTGAVGSYNPFEAFDGGSPVE